VLGGEDFGFPENFHRYRIRTRGRGGVEDVGDQAGSRMSTAEKTITAATTLTSLFWMESMNHSPIPCQPKIFSVNVAPVNRSPKL